ncbi:Acyl-[acyl-carrier-protein]--UDP-N-acetylglucosamine O-acyltransferase [Pirellulimonas nuda]|uniref:Acyl-[acyl-carrier-protein]--UDP-N-acetylglucosamine O-acyltransferase n=1 Tax=Pirellulimonas nuda TaxID=2528009 RepID=A0A518DHV6_9BACT|nr:acyl-ACP--UDP-N-acetylglucosamine O-acyltransferase [Pirellulimonas nuda]QDU91055.1 Acyl-[acyl-carrier-protein]--UDP-N-acetylglucosamine O-acyltransferase [Pirellulimonas nuda]
MAIHPLALVHPSAQVAADAEVGPFCNIEAGVVVGAGCTIAARVSIKSGVTMGQNNVVEEGAVIGGVPQHLLKLEHLGPVVIGDRNVIRENVTIHRAMHAEGATRIGNECLLMVGSHVAHDCTLSNNVVLTNNVMLAGHVWVGERAYLGGGAAVQQHCRIGRIAMVGGLARVPQDIPPFVTIDGGTGMVVGLNRVGLRRAGLDIAEVQQIKEAYRVLYRSGLSLEQRMTTLATRFPAGPASEFEQFIHDSGRGFARERRMPPSGAIRPLHTEAADTAAPAAQLRAAG